MYNINIINNSLKMVEEGYKTRKEINEAYEKKNSQLYFKYAQLENELTAKKYAEQRSLEEEKKNWLEALEAEVEEAKNTKLNFNKTIKLMDIEKRDLTGGKCYVYKNSTKEYYQAIDKFIENEFINIDTYITKNKKPKNCYDLILVGNTMFSEDLIKSIYSYGITAHTENTNIRILVKDFATKEQAQAYYDKNKSKIAKDIISAHKELENDWIEVKANTNTKEWRKLYLEEKKRYYETAYSNFEKEPKYIEIVKELKCI
jgi:hypothetical protein